MFMQLFWFHLDAYIRVFMIMNHTTLVGIVFHMDRFVLYLIASFSFEEFLCFVEVGFLLSSLGWDAMLTSRGAESH